MKLGELTNRIQSGLFLEKIEVVTALEGLLDESEAESEKISFLMALTSRGESAEEIAAFTLALREKAVPVDLNHDKELPLVDVCGTGGDNRNTFNVSTCVAFILSSAGVHVAKHGNRGITSKSGGFDVLDALGIRFELSLNEIQSCFQKNGICFLFAPHFHPVFKKLAPLRKAVAERGSRTIFNLLGPLLNPASPTAQLIGVPDFKWAPIHAAVVKKMGLESAMVVCGRTASGHPMDEISVFGISDISELKKGTIRQFLFDPHKYGLWAKSDSKMSVNSAQESAEVILNILKGEDLSWKKDIVLVNAGAAFMIANRVNDWMEGIELAREQIISKRALAKLKQLQAGPE